MGEGEDEGDSGWGPLGDYWGVTRLAQPREFDSTEEFQSSTNDSIRKPAHEGHTHQMDSLRDFHGPSRGSRSPSLLAHEAMRRALMEGNSSAAVLFGMGNALPFLSLAVEEMGLVR